MHNPIGTGDLKVRDTVIVKVESNLSGKVYEGAFTWRRRTLKDIGEISIVQSQLTSGQKIVSEMFERIITAIAELTVVVESFPDWWEEVKEIPDTNVILQVYTEYVKWIAAPFRKGFETQDREGSNKDSS